MVQHSSDQPCSSPIPPQSSSMADNHNLNKFEDGTEDNFDGPGADITVPQSPQENNVQDLWDFSYRNEQHKHHERPDFGPRQHRLRFDVDFELSDGNNSENDDSGNSDHDGHVASDIELEESDSQDSDAEDARTPHWSRQDYTR